MANENEQSSTGGLSLRAYLSRLAGLISTNDENDKDALAVETKSSVSTDEIFVAVNYKIVPA